MMVYRTNSGRAWKLRVADQDGTARVCSTGTTDQGTALDVEAMVKRFQKRRRWAPLNAVVAKQTTLAKVYDADVAGTLDELLAALSVPDLSPLVTEWASAGAVPKYVVQVRRIIPDAEKYPATNFTRKNISAFLAGLKRQSRTGRETTEPASDRTKNRYRSALSVFARWLIEREVIETNPVRDVAAKADPGPRETHLEPQQARALIEALPAGQQRALEAMLCGTGAELGALLNARRRDFDLTERTLHCFPGYAGRKGKTRYRSRVVEVTEDWCWPHIEPYVSALPANARLFTLSENVAHKAHDRTVKAIGLPPVTLHDWRHTYAVESLRRGDDHAQIRRQLGHAPQSTLLYTSYGVYSDKPVGRTARQRSKLGNTPTPLGLSTDFATASSEDGSRE